MHEITFVSEGAVKNRKALFITPMHPLVKQAALFFSSNRTAYLHIQHISDEIPEGTYMFSIYAWNYVGLQPLFKVVPVCDHDIPQDEMVEILTQSDPADTKINVDPNAWRKLEEKHVLQWMQEKANYQESARTAASFKLESLRANYRNRKRNLEQKINDAFEERMLRMYQSELSGATENYNTKVAEMNERIERTDIHTTLVANGVLEIRRG